MKDTILDQETVDESSVPSFLWLCSHHVLLWAPVPRLEKDGVAPDAHKRPFQALCLRPPVASRIQGWLEARDLICFGAIPVIS